MIQFQGTTFINKKYVRDREIGGVLVKHGGLVFIENSEGPGDLCRVVTDRFRNPKTEEIDADLRELGEKAAVHHGIDPRHVFYQSPRANLGKSWERELVHRLTLDLEA